MLVGGLNPIATPQGSKDSLVWSVQHLFYANIHLSVIILLARFRGDLYSEGDFSEWPNTGVATFQGS